MILLDTHVWIWLCHGDPHLPLALRDAIEFHRQQGLAVSAISVWEVAKLIERGRIELPLELDRWFETALEGSDVRVLPLSVEIATASTRLPGTFHRDPADQIIVATARVHDLKLATCDEKILGYPYVRTVSEETIHDR